MRTEVIFLKYASDFSQWLKLNHSKASYVEAGFDQVGSGKANIS
jgi:hypothetical protein